MIYFKLSWYPLFCLESRCFSRFDFCEITPVQPLFLPKKEVSNKILQNGRNYHSTAFTFLLKTNFFFASTKIFGRFHRFGKFFGPNSPPKKTQSMWKDIFLFFSDSLDFLWISYKMPTKKPDITKKQKNITFATAFFARIWHKTLLSYVELIYVRIVHILYVTSCVYLFGFRFFLMDTIISPFTS